MISELNIAKDAAIEAGGLILKYYKADYEIKDNLDTFSSKDPKSYERSIRKLSRNFLNCLKNPKSSCDSHLSQIDYLGGNLKF